MMAACRKEHVEAANCRIMPRTLVEFGNVCLALPRDFFIAELAGIGGCAAARRNEPHVAVIVIEILIANHHAADGVLAKVFAEETIDFACRFRSFGRDRGFANCVRWIRMAFDGNVINAKSATVTDGNCVFASTHFGRSGNHECGVASARLGEQRACFCAVHGNLRFKPVVLLDENFRGEVIDGRFFDFDFECKAVCAGLHVLAARKSFSRYNRSCVNAGLTFGFVRCRRSISRCCRDRCGNCHCGTYARD